MGLSYRNAPPALRIGVTQSVAYTATAGTIANAVTEGVRWVRVYCTTDAFIKVGKNPTATTGDMPVSAGVAEYFVVGQGEKVSAVQQSTGGTLYATEVTR